MSYFVIAVAATDCVMSWYSMAVVVGVVIVGVVVACVIGVALITAV